jgi:CHAD domain-containing protein
MHRLIPRIKDFSRTIDGVKEGTDAEYVHGMRVASRRLRSALPLFSFCFPKRRYRRWMKEIRAITRALGDARDTDVQIAFLETYIPGHHPINGSHDTINALFELLLARRKQQQADVLLALESLEESHTIADLSASLRLVNDAADNNDGKSGIPPGLYRRAADQVNRVLDELVAYDPVVRNPDDASGHHRVRIATKKLRYTLEIYSPLYPDQCRPAIRNLKRLQKILGELHDCDVWAHILAMAVHTHHKQYLERRKGSIPVFPIEPVLVNILLNRKTQRDLTYTRLSTVWQMCHTKGIWRDLRAEIDAAAQTTPAKETLQKSSGTVRSLAPVHALTASFPEGKGHADQVTRLALILFDELASLHQYSKKERFLLECAGLLHDIGWAFGQKGHHTQSYTMILNDSALPFTVRERSIIALVARYHRKTDPTLDHSVYADLKSKDKKTVQALSAILRVADGLDYTHANRISGISCTVTEDQVLCRLEGHGDFTVERDRAIRKSNLFEQVFGRRLSFP